MAVNSRHMLMWARIHSRIRHSQSVFSANEFAPTFYDHAIRKDEDMKAIASRFGMLSGCKQPPCTYMWARIHSRIRHSQSVFSTNEFAPTFYDHAIRKDEDMKAIASRFGMLSGCKQPPCTYMWARIHSRIRHSQSVFSANEFAPTL